LRKRQFIILINIKYYFIKTSSPRPSVWGCVHAFWAAAKGGIQLPKSGQQISGLMLTVFFFLLFFIFSLIFTPFPHNFESSPSIFFFSNLAHVFLITICFCQNNLLNYNLFSISSSLDFFHLSYLILILLITIWFIWDNFFFMISFSFIFLHIIFDLHFLRFFFIFFLLWKVFKLIFFFWFHYSTLNWLWIKLFNWIQF